MARWVLSPLARTELEDILEYIATDSGSVEVADKVAADFLAALRPSRPRPTLAGSVSI